MSWLVEGRSSRRRKRGWYVSTDTALVRFSLRRDAAETVLAARRVGRSALLIRECECGCGEPAGRAVAR